MLIKISVEPGAAFDILSILEIKITNCENFRQRDALHEQKERLQAEINQTIGYDFARKIYFSDFYTNLYNANLAVFDQIDKEKSNADLLNYERFVAKKNLQEEFFHEEIAEVKLGF